MGQAPWSRHLCPRREAHPPGLGTTTPPAAEGVIQFTGADKAAWVGPATQDRLQPRIQMLIHLSPHG